MKKKLFFILTPIVVALVAAPVLFTGGPVDGAVDTVALKFGEQAEQRIGKAGLSQSLKPAAGFGSFADGQPDRAFRSDIAFFETVLSYGRNTDSRNTFLLLNAYLNTNQQVQGIAFFERLLKRHGENMDGQLRATNLAAYAILRATHADKVPLLSRIGWVTDTFDILEEAKALTKGRHVLVRWSAGMIYAQVPFFFFKRDAAYAELTWLADHPETEPVMGFFREVYRRLAILHAEDGDKAKAARYLKRSGYGPNHPKSMFMGWFTSENSGASMGASPTLTEIVPDQIYALYGYGFSDVYFVISDDGNQTIAVDAGTQPHSLQAAHERLKSHVSGLPPVTTLIVTHAHWDHVGGHTYLKSLNPDLKIYGRGNFSGTLERTLRKHSYHQYRGAGHKRDWIEGYRPDIEIAETTRVTVGGTGIELVPVTGGETEDALLAYLPGSKAIFVGDILMPYYGEPWVEEGFIDETVATIDEVIARDPKHVLHGHRPLTLMYSAAQLQQYRGHFEWLVEATRAHIREGYSVQDIVRMNLIPPDLQNHPDAYISYLSPRDHIVARVADDMVGIWREDRTGQEPGGLDTVTAVEYGRFLEIYLDLSPRDVAKALRRTIDGGDNELALQMATAALKRYPSDGAIKGLRVEAADRLRSAYQFFDPFKFIAYTEMTGQEHKPMPPANPVAR